MCCGTTAGSVRGSIHLKWLIASWHNLNLTVQREFILERRGEREARKWREREMCESFFFSV
jgi:hypothetical protein